MEITEVRIFPKSDSDKKLRAFVTITLDDAFVIRDIKVIEGKNGLFVAMPSRKIRESCPKCHHRNVIDASFCNRCGSKLEFRSAPPAADSEDEKKQRQGEHRDIAHPINLECREYVQKTILDAYQAQISGNQGDVS